MAKTLQEILAGGRPRKAAHQQLIIYHFSQDDPLAEFLVRGLLNEQRPSVDLGKNRSILFHKAHVHNTEDHLHFMVKGAKIAAINQSGTAHDKSHGVKLQRWALDGMAKYYPDFKRPPNGLIEALIDETSSRLISESFGENGILLSKALRDKAESEACQNS